MARQGGTMIWSHANVWAGGVLPEIRTQTIHQDQRAGIAALAELNSKHFKSTYVNRLQ